MARASRLRRTRFRSRIKARTATTYGFASPGQSQYVVPVQLLTGTVGTTVRLPFVPDSMVMDRLGTNLYFGSDYGTDGLQHGLELCLQTGLQCSGGSAGGCSG